MQYSYNGVFLVLYLAAFIVFDEFALKFALERYGQFLW